MKGVDWGVLYNAYKDADLDFAWIEAETQRLILDDDVTNQKGIYPFILTGDEKHLNIRAFPAGMKQRVYEKQERKCKICDKSFDISDMEADHITPWSEGGKTEQKQLPDAMQEVQSGEISEMTDNKQDKPKRPRGETATRVP